MVGALVERGQILHSDIFEEIDHPKFFVIIGVSKDEIAGLFYINSSINRAVNRKPEQLAMQYPLSVSDYHFLDHSSYICATDVQKIKKSELTQSIMHKRTKSVGVLKNEHLEELLNKLRNSRLFSPIIKQKFFY